MGSEEKRIVKYVMFGKRENLTQFPETSPAEILTGADETTEFRPVYLFWDKTDEVMVRFYEQWRNSEKTGLASVFGRTLSVVAKRHIQNKYKEVFLSNPETLFLSERAKEEIPRGFWREEPVTQEELFAGFGREAAVDILKQTTRSITVFFVLGRECRYDEVWEWLLEAETAAGPDMTNLFLLGEPQQQEYGEDILERFYTETGLAGSFYEASECRRIIAMTTGDVLLLDCLGLPLGQLGRPAYYIDGTGVRTGKEMRRLTGVCKACHSLRNHLDRAFLSAL